MLQCLHSALRGKTSSFASKRELPYFFQTHIYGQEKKRNGSEKGRGAFICRFLLKWTVSLAAEEHVLCIIHSFEYKSSWGEACELGPSGRLVTVN